jgi:hypothetical protein
VEAPPLASAPPTKKGKWGAKAPKKTGTEWAPRSASVTGRGRKSTTALADQVLVNLEAGASDELSLVIRQSFKDGRYSPSTGMEEIEWQLMLEQFIASGVVVKDEIINIEFTKQEIINIDSDRDLFVVVFCLQSLCTLAPSLLL